jgi:hypothetical protein
MKNGNVSKTLAAMSLVAALFAGRSVASFWTMPVGSIDITTYATGPCNNPNGFPVVLVWSAPAGVLGAFLLDGSESASNWLKTLQDANLNHHAIVIGTDDDPAHGYCGEHVQNGQGGIGIKILSVELVP